MSCAYHWQCYLRSCSIVMVLVAVAEGYDYFNCTCHSMVIVAITQTDCFFLASFGFGCLAGNVPGTGASNPHTIRSIVSVRYEWSSKQRPTAPHQGKSSRNQLWFSLCRAQNVLICLAFWAGESLTNALLFFLFTSPSSFSCVWFL